MNLGKELRATTSDAFQTPLDVLIWNNDKPPSGYSWLAKLGLF